MVTELAKNLFIPDAPMAEPVPYRCIPRIRVVHTNKGISSEQPDDSIPVLRRGKDGTGSRGSEMKESILADGTRSVDPRDFAPRNLKKKLEEVSPSRMRDEARTGGY